MRREFSDNPEFTADSLTPFSKMHYERQHQRIQEGATRGNREQSLAILGKVPDIEPEAYDKI